MEKYQGLNILWAAMIVQALKDYARGYDVDNCRVFLLDCCKSPRRQKRINEIIEGIDTGNLRPVFCKQKASSIRRALLSYMGEGDESIRSGDNGTDLADG